MLVGTVSLPAIWLALALDILLGEPPSALHPVAWLGSLIGVFRRIAPKQGRVVPFLAGIVFVFGGAAIVAGLAWTLQIAIRTLPWYVAIGLEALFLKLTFSIRGLILAGRSVYRELAANRLPEARTQLSWHLVSRPTDTLDSAQVAAATIESLTENTSDSVVAPLLFYAVLGLPGAWAYRFVNTCDAMLGYRDAEREWLGKAAARFDDLLNLVPARFTALAFLLTGSVVTWQPARAVAVWWRDNMLTASPNAGHPMSAAAGTLGVELEKVGCYRLGAGTRLPVAGDILRAAWLVALASLVSVVVLSLTIVLVR